MTSTTSISKEYRKLDDDIILKLSGYIRKGSYAVTACKCCMVNEATFYNWIKEAEEHEKLGLDETTSLPVKLRKSIEKAQADCEHELASMIKETALEKREWLPAMTFLERRHPERWGRKDRLQVDETKRVEITVIEYAEQLPTKPVTAQIIEGEVKVLEDGK